MGGLTGPVKGRAVKAGLVLVGALLTGCSAVEVPRVHVLTEQELEDMVVGAAIYCARGINTQGMLDRLRSGLAGGVQVTMLPLEEMPDDWMGFTSFGIGGGGAWPEVVARYQGQDLSQGGESRRPEEILSEYIGRDFQVTFQAEAGGATVGTLLTAARMGIPILDGGPSGRCLPEVQMSPFYVKSQITRAPFAGVTRYGDVFIVPSVRDDFRTEDLTRALAVASGGGVSVAANALSGEVLKRHLIPGFLTQSIRVGRAAREAVQRGQDPVSAVVEAGGGYLLFRGRVTRSDSRGERGFGWTDAYLEGLPPYEGEEYHIFNKNENMVAWRNGKLDAAAPDIIIALDPRTGWAMRGGEVIGSFVEGEELAIIGLPASPLWRTPEGIRAMGPRHFGFDVDYVPLEELHGGRR